MLLVENLIENVKWKFSSIPPLQKKLGPKSGAKILGS